MKKIIRAALGVIGLIGCIFIIKVNNHNILTSALYSGSTTKPKLNEHAVIKKLSNLIGVGIGSGSKIITGSRIMSSYGIEGEGILQLSSGDSIKIFNHCASNSGTMRSISYIDQSNYCHSIYSNTGSKGILIESGCGEFYTLQEADKTNMRMKFGDNMYTLTKQEKTEDGNIELEHLCYKLIDVFGVRGYKPNIPLNCSKYIKTKLYDPTVEHYLTGYEFKNKSFNQSLEKLIYMRMNDGKSDICYTEISKQGGFINIEKQSGRLFFMRNFATIN